MSLLLMKSQSCCCPHCGNTETASTRFERCQQCIQCPHKVPRGAGKPSTYCSLIKPHGSHWAGKGPTEAGENGMERPGCEGREFADIMDLENNAEKHLVDENEGYVHNALCRSVWPISKFTYK